MLRSLATILALTCAVSSGQIKVLTIGDSITDEYGAISGLDNIFTIDSVYPEPDDPNPDNNPRAFNWPELLTFRRSSEVDFGNFGSWTTFFFGLPIGGDTRYEGYRYNFALVAMTTQDWVNILTGNTSDFSLPFLFNNTGTNLLNSLGSVDVAVILLGGNDLKDQYDTLFNTGPPEQLLTDIHDRIETIHSIVRTQAPNLPIIVATVPDVGATPEVFNTYNTPSIQAATRAKIAGMNQDIIDTFSAKPNTVIARVDNLTNDLLDIELGIVPGPYDLNGTEFILGGDPFNAPEYLFCKDDFHPHTVGQALIANEVIDAVNTIYPDSITPLSNRDILDILLLDPDQPYLDWIAGFGLTADGPDDDPDRDGLVNLIEMILGTPPNAFSSPFTGTWPDGVTWVLSDDRYAEFTAEESPDLSGWTPVPPERISVSGSQRTATPPDGEDSHFLRFNAAPRP